MTKRNDQIVYLTEDELRRIARPSRMGLWLILLAGPLGVLAAQIIIWMTR